MGALPQHLHFLRGVLHLILEATPAQASPQLLLLLGLVGGQLLGAQTHKHTCTKQSLLSSAESEPPNGAAGFVSGGMAQTAPTVPCAPQGKSEGQRGLLGPQTKNQPSLPRCLFGRCSLSNSLPLPRLQPPSVLPWREQTSLGAGFHSDSIQPFLALSFRTGWERSPPFTSYFFPAPGFVKGCLQWS